MPRAVVGPVGRAGAAFGGRGGERRAFGADGAGYRERGGAARRFVDVAGFFRRVRPDPRAEGVVVAGDGERGRGEVGVLRGAGRFHRAGQVEYAASAGAEEPRGATGGRHLRVRAPGGVPGPTCPGGCAVEPADKRVDDRQAVGGEDRQEVVGAVDDGGPGQVPGGDGGAGQRPDVFGQHGDPGVRGDEVHVVEGGDDHGPGPCGDPELPPQDDVAADKFDLLLDVAVVVD